MLSSFGLGVVDNGIHCPETCSRWHQPLRQPLTSSLRSQATRLHPGKQQCTSSCPQASDQDARPTRLQKHEKNKNGTSNWSKLLLSTPSMELSVEAGNVVQGTNHLVRSFNQHAAFGHPILDPRRPFPFWLLIMQGRPTQCLWQP